jgi:phosphate transport system substrate-binding protein
VTRRPISHLPLLALAAALLLTAGAGLLWFRRSGPAPARETLLIAGNAVMIRYLDPVIKEFQARHPHTSVVAEPGGTTAAVIALKRGAIDLAAMSRLSSADEDDPYFRDVQIFRDALAVVVHPSNPLDNVTLKQLELVYDGQETGWKALGGADTPIAAWARDKANKTTARSFNELVLGGDDPFAGAHFATSSKAILEAVRGDPRAIGYVTLRHVLDGAAGLKTLQVEGVELNRRTILSGRYPLSRTFYLGVYLKPTPAAEEFLRFACSREGQEIFAKDGQLAVR